MFSKKLTYEQKILLERQYYTYLLMSKQNNVVIDCYVKQAYKCFKILKDHGIVVKSTNGSLV